MKRNLKDNGFVLSSELETFLMNDAAKISRRNFFTFKEEAELIAEALVEIRTAPYDPTRIVGDKAKYNRTIIHHAIVRAAKKIADERSEWTRDRDSLDAQLGDDEDSTSRMDVITTEQTLGENDVAPLPTPTRQIARDLRNQATRDKTLSDIADRNAVESAAKATAFAARADATAESIGARPFATNAFEQEVLREESPDIWRDDAPFKVSARAKGGVAKLTQLHLDQHIEAMWVLERLAPIDRRLCKLVLAGWEIGDAAKLLGIAPSRLSRTIRKRLQIAFSSISYILGKNRK